MKRHYMILVGYQPPQTLALIHDEISRNSHSWWHYMENVWIVCTDKSIATWQKWIACQLQEGGHLLLIELHHGERQGLLPQQAWTWLKGHIH